MANGINIPAIMTDNSISLFFDGSMKTLPSSSTHFERVKELVFKVIPKLDVNTQVAELNTCLTELRTLLDVKKYVALLSCGRVTITDDALLIDGVPLHNALVTRIIGMFKQGFDVRPIMAFLEKVHSNPNDKVQDELYLFLESGNMPITNDGDFLAFKKVQSDYFSYHAGRDGKKVYHGIGSTPSVNREDVDPDRNATCSYGLHFCSYTYLPSYFGNEGRVLIVKVNPYNVIAIPNDYGNAKGRADTYQVIGEIPESEAAIIFNNTPVIASFGEYDGSDCDFDPFDNPVGLDDYSRNGDGNDEENARMISEAVSRSTSGAFLDDDDDLSDDDTADYGRWNDDEVRSRQDARDQDVLDELADEDTEPSIVLNGRTIAKSVLEKLIHDNGVVGTSMVLNVSPRSIGRYRDKLGIT